MNLVYFGFSLLLAGIIPTDAATMIDNDILNENGLNEYWAEYFTPEENYHLTPEMLFANLAPEQDTPDLVEMDPGILPEGDAIYDLTYTNDGTKVIVTNFLSQSISIIDQASLSIDTTFTVQGYPGEARCSDEYIIVALPFDNLIEVYNLNTYQLELSTPSSGEQPWVVRVNEDNNHAYIASDISNICDVIDLSSMEKVQAFNDFPLSLWSMTGSYETNRTFFGFSDFTILPGRNLIGVSDQGADEILFINATTGVVEHTVSLVDPGLLALSGDGNYLITRSGSYDPLTLIRVDLSTYTVDYTVEAPGYDAHAFETIAVNYDGSKAYSDGSSNSAILVKFLTNNYVVFGPSETASPNWVGSNYDHTQAISSQLRFALIDFATETMVDKLYNKTYWNGDACISPVSNHVAAIYPLFYEQVHFYSFPDDEIDFLGDVLSGSPVEGDGPTRVSISQDGTVAVVSNTLSDNVTIVNPSTLEIEAIVDVGDRVHDSAITSDSKWAVVCATGSASLETEGPVTVIDLETYTIAAIIETGDHSSSISITPDDSYAYVANLAEETVSVIHLDGASSTKVTDIPCAGFAGTWAIPNGIFNMLEVSPDGQYCLVTAGFNDMVRLIDTSTNTVVANINAGDYPLHATFNSDGTRAIVSNFYS
ncbi:MAG: hypothetical protein U9P42_08505, partial [Candidatus Fermentibacteria bacterium]|nr:hypothetical protein [Candidatus Fermentibacteria bacterium]